MFLLIIDLAKRKKIIIFIIFLLAFFVLGQAVLAGDYGLNETAGVAFDDDIPFETAGPAEIIGKVVGAALAFIGILFFVLMIYGGFLWMTARGNEEQVKKSIELIISAVVGIIIVASAYLITQFIGETLLTPTATPTSPPAN